MESASESSDDEKTFSGMAADREIVVEAVDKMVVLWTTLLRNCSGSKDHRRGCQARWSRFGLRFSGITADRKIVVKAVRQDGRALDYASQKLQRIGRSS